MNTGKMIAIVSMPSSEVIHEIANKILNEVDDRVSIEAKKENIMNIINESINITVVAEKWEGK